MAASARIDELRSKFDDNPRRYFAPLANEYRKAGDLETAIAICRTQLRHFPTHMSGHVVLGQALYEAGALPEARTAFARAAELDPENVIALRHLGDIARGLGDDADARLWYQRVLDADPYNEQIAAHLAALAERAPDETEASRFAPTANGAGHPPAGLAEVSDSVADPRVEAATFAEVEFIDLGSEALAWSVNADPGVERAEGTSEGAAEPGALFVDGWEVLGPTADEAAAPPVMDRLVEADAPDASVELADRSVDTLDPVVGLDLAPAHDAAAEQLAHSAEPAAPPPVEAIWPPDDAQPLDAMVSGAFVTETMAELCLRQGHDEQALAIYEQLIAQRPGDTDLAQRADGIRARVGGGPAAVQAEVGPIAGDFFAELAERVPEPAAALPVAESPGATQLDDEHETDFADRADRPDESPDRIAEPTPAARAANDLSGIDDPQTVEELRPVEEPAELPTAADVESPAEPEAVHGLSERDEWAGDAWAAAFRVDIAEGPSLVDELFARAAADPAPSAPALADEAPLADDVADDDVDLSFDRFFVGEADDRAIAEPHRFDGPSSDATVADSDASDVAHRSSAAIEPEPSVVEDSEEDLAAFNAWLRGIRDS